MSARVSVMPSAGCRIAPRGRSLRAALLRLRHRLDALTFRMPLPARVLCVRPFGTDARAIGIAALKPNAIVAAETGGRTARGPVTIANAPPALAAEMAAWATMPIDPPRSHVATLDRVIVRDGLITTDTGVVLAESLINRAPGETMPKPRRLTLLRRLNDRPYAMLKQHWDANYGHWLVEGLPRLALVEEHHDLAELGYIVSGHHGAMQAIYEDSLALFGIRREQIVELGREPVAVDRLIYPTPMTQHPWHIAPRCIALLEQLASRVRAAPNGFERIYVSRNRATQRHLANEDEIIALVRRHGFMVIEPESMTLYQQIGLFRNARMVVGNYGAALTNVAFAAGSPTLFALTTPLMQDDFFSTLMSLKKGRYVSLHGEALDAHPTQNSHFRIDVPRFRSMLEVLV